MNGPLDLYALEAEVLDFWRENRIIERFAERNPDGERWATYEGPPTVNGKPALHHVFTSMQKDIYGRFQLLRGKRVDRKAGWDCQGLPVEIAVERKLQLKNKREIVEYGIGAFVAECRKTVEENIADFQKVLLRYGYWVDYENAYKTMDDSFLESVWWHIQKMWNDGMLYEGHKVVPYCTRCATALSSHELGQPGVYRETVHEAAYVAMPLTDGFGDLVIWTTTPWTLPANVAVAVNPTMTYGRYRSGDRTIIVAVSRVGEVDENAELIDQFPGTDLVGRTYERPYPSVTADSGKSAIVIGTEDVAEDVGTGLLHVAPAFGEEDSQMGAREGLAVINTLDADGNFKMGPFTGKLVHETSPLVLEDLAQRGILVSKHNYEHQYPHCWRCQTPLIYWAKPTWFIKTASRRQELIDENEKVTWHPEHLKHGRFGNWLKDNVDWAVSRDRFWGTPLPIWRCPSGHDTCVGSRADLTRLTGTDQSNASLHRPEIDEVKFACPECGETAVRQEPVCDVWLDSGCVPAAQWLYPENDNGKFELNFPADFICEALDQTRGWFYSLLAANTLVFGQTPFKNAVCLGLLVDDEGRKMSKSLGNVIDPIEVLPKYGADGIRWYLLTSSAPWGTRRVSMEAIEQRTRRDFDTLWNVTNFYVSYAEIERFESTGEISGEDILDKWILSRLNALIKSSGEEMEGYQGHKTVQAISEFIDDLSNWYVRRSRRRFWENDRSAFETLSQVLRSISILLASFCPFLAEGVFRKIDPQGGSVHLADWPSYDESLIHPEFEREMADARRVSALVRTARSEAGIAVRQPLATVVVTGIGELSEDVRRIVQDEANVQSIVRGDEAALPIEYKLKPNWRVFGPRHRDIGGALAAALEGNADQEIFDKLRNGKAVTISVDGTDAEVQPDEVEVSEVRLSGWQMASEAGVSVALETTLNDELIYEGERRTLIRFIQVARREGGLAIQDRIRLWMTPKFMADAKLVGSEVLAEDILSLDDVPDDADLIRGEGFAFQKM